jgi:hypothetical protein
MPHVVPVYAARRPSELAIAVVAICVVVKPELVMWAAFMRAKTGSSFSTRSSGVASAVLAK